MTRSGVYIDRRSVRVPAVDALNDEY